MTQKLEGILSEDATAEDDPYASARAKLSGSKNKRTPGASARGTLERKHGESTEEEQRRAASSVITVVSLAASVATIFSAMQGLQPPESNLTIPSLLPVMAAFFDSNYQPKTPVAEPRITDDSGALDAYAFDGKVLGQCPLKHTSVDAKVSGYTARVTVKQIFRNPFKEKIEARYRFPLSHEGAVDDMTMKVGNRLVKGEIKRKEEASRIYQEAKNAGQVASLLDQERTNIFTQSVANLESGKEIEITIKYTEILNYKDGAFQFVFPTVVGERFDPYDSTAAYANVSDLSGHEKFRLTSFGPSTKTNTAPEGTRPGHDISINVAVDAGLPITNLTSHLHGIIAHQPNNHSALVSLKQAATIPNRDFVLDIAVAKQGLNSGYVATRNGKDGFVTVMVMPPKKVDTKQIAPRELVFLVDCSGSQAGAAIQKSRETLKYVVDHANENDTFQIVTFNDNVQTLFEKPEKLNLTRKFQAKMFIDKITAVGGTWMAGAVEATCSMPADDNRLRIVSFMTDGFVGNDYEVIGLVKKLRGTSRWFPFGVGDSVNRTLIDGISKQGGGESEFVLLNDSAEEVGRKFYERIASPVLTDVRLSADGVELLDVYPRAVSDVWSDKPLYFNARYEKPGTGRVFITGFWQGKPYRQEIKLQLPEKNDDNSQVGQIWARAKIDALTAEDWDGAQTGVMPEHLKNEIVKTALSHHLLSQFTSFVAVDTKRVTKGTSLASVDVPINTPQGAFDSTDLAQTSSPSVVPPNPNIPYGCSNSNQTSKLLCENPVADKVIGRAFARVTANLNSLSAAAGSAGSASSAGVPSNAGLAYSPLGGSSVSSNPALDSNFGDLLLLPWSLFPGAVRAAIIILLVTLAACKAHKLSKQVRAQESVSQTDYFVTVLLFTVALALAIGHLNIVNFPKS